MASSASRQPARGLPPRQAHVAEQRDDFDEQEGEDDTEEVFDADAAEAQPSLEEVLQAEAEVLAAELEQAAEEGADDEVLGGLEASVETGAGLWFPCARPGHVCKKFARTEATRHRPRLRARRVTVVVVDLGQLLFESNLGSILASIAGSMATGPGMHPASTPAKAWQGRRTSATARQVRVAEHEAQVMEFDIGGLVGTQESREALVVAHGDLGFSKMPSFLLLEAVRT